MNGFYQITSLSKWSPTRATNEIFLIFQTTQVLKNMGWLNNDHFFQNPKTTFTEMSIVIVITLSLSINRTREILRHISAEVHIFL